MLSVWGVLAMSHDALLNRSSTQAIAAPGAIPKIMGIVNVTPDSFSDGGSFLDTQKAIDHAWSLAEEGADILDIGGESTRPGADPVSAQEEIDRVIPVIEGLKDVSVDISIDTYRSGTMRAALNAGATIVNDVTALTGDSESIDVAVDAKLVCLMHKQGAPKDMQSSPVYNDVVQDVFDYLHGRILVCEDAGIDRRRIVIDPGIGFGKTLEHNILLIKNIDKFHDLGCDILLGTSRKSFIEMICSDTSVHQRLAGSLVSALAGWQKGASYVRVHDVADTLQAFRVYAALL